MITAHEYETAERWGIEFALRDIAQGATSPEPEPLSGKLGITQTTIADDLGLETAGISYWEDVETVSDQWETGYFSTWASHLDLAPSAG